MEKEADQTRATITVKYLKDLRSFQWRVLARKLLKMLLQHPFWPTDLIRCQIIRAVLFHQLPSVAKKVIVPPIIVKNLQFAQIQEIIKNLNTKNHSYKFMSIGIKIQVSTLSDHDVLNKKFISDNNFFTYDTVKNTNSKFVLSGLPSLSTD